MPKPRTFVWETQPCGAKTRSGAPCKTAAMDNGRCRMHGGKSPGGPIGNQKRRTHGIFAKSLDQAGQETYKAAKGVPTEELARDAAEFLLARVAAACRSDADLKGATARAVAFVEQEMLLGTIGPEAGAAIIRKVREPDITMVAKSLGPVKGLLEVAAPKDKDAPDPGAASSPVIQVPVADWLELVKPKPVEPLAE